MPRSAPEGFLTSAKSHAPRVLQTHAPVLPCCVCREQARGQQMCRPRNQAPSGC